MGNVPGKSAKQVYDIAATPIMQNLFEAFVLEWPLSRIIHCSRLYREDFFLNPLQCSDVEFILDCENNDEVKVLFSILNEHCVGSGGLGGAGNVASCDGLALLGGLGLSCRSHLVDRLKFVFSLYDFDASSSLSLPELTMMLKTTLDGMAALRNLSCPAIEDLHLVAKQIFATAQKGRSEEVTLDEFVDWVAIDPAKRFFESHSNTLKRQLCELASDKDCAFELAEAQFLQASSTLIDLSQKYLATEGLKYFIEDMRTHAKHADNSVIALILKGNGISSSGLKDIIDLLSDAAADRYGPLGHYLGHIEELDVSGNTRINNDISPALLHLVRTCRHLRRLNLKGTKISMRVRDQIDHIIRERRSASVSTKEQGEAQKSTRAKPDGK